MGKSGGTRPVPKGSLAHQIYSDPFLDWVIIVMLSVAAALVLVVAGTSVYLEIKENLAASEIFPGEKAVTLIDTAALDKVLQEFERRSQERYSVLRGYVAPRDPSLP